MNPSEKDTERRQQNMQEDMESRLRQYEAIIEYQASQLREALWRLKTLESSRGVRLIKAVRAARVGPTQGSHCLWEAAKHRESWQADIQSPQFDGCTAFPEPPVQTRSCSFLAAQADRDCTVAHIRQKHWASPDIRRHSRVRYCQVG